MANILDKISGKATADLQAQITQLTEAHAKALADANATIATHVATIAAHTKTIEDLNAKVKTAEDALVTANATITENTKTISDLNAKVKTTETTVDAKASAKAQHILAATGTQPVDASVVENPVTASADLFDQWQTLIQTDPAKAEEFQKKNYGALMASAYAKAKQESKK